MEKEKLKREKRSLELLNKNFGDKVSLGSEPTKVNQDVLPCPSPGLSDAVNYWGFPKGKITQFYGPEGCLDSDTFINYKISDSDGNIINKKGGSIERLYERFHGLNVPGRGKSRVIPQGAEFTAPSINEEGRIFHNNILDVVKTGQKDCLLIKTKKHEIVATEEHKFWTGAKFVKAGDLSVGSTIQIHNNTRFKKELAERQGKRFEVMVKFHPNGRLKKIKDGITGRIYEYYRVRRSRAVVEASLNQLSYNDYIARLNSDSPGHLFTLSNKVHVHHLDEDFTNDDISNLAVLDPRVHNREHALEQHNNLRFMAVDDEILSISKVGKRNTYDIKMESPYNNYIANGFVVHNSGKTFMAMLEVLEAQKQDPTARQLWLDCEYSFSMDWAQNLGIDIDRLLHVEENNAAEVFGIFCGEPTKPGVLDMVIAGDLNVNLIVLDSIAALIPPVEDGRTFSDQNIAALARFLPGAFRVAVSKLSRANVPMICINQAREAIGNFLGGLTYPGGRTYRHMCSLNILFNTSLAKKATLYDEFDSEKKVGHKINCIVEKTRGGVNRAKTEMWLDFTKGVVKIGEDVATLGAGYGIIERPSNVKWVYKDNEIIGKENFFEFLDNNDSIRNELLEEIKILKRNGGRVSNEVIASLEEDAGQGEE